jgi:hypothetical protein
LKENAMDDRRPVQPPPDMPDLPNLGLLAGVIFAAFVVLGATVYFFGEHQSPQTAANNSPPRMQRTTKPAPAPPAEQIPSTIGQGGMQ